MAEIDYILLNEKAKTLVRVVRDDSFTDSNTSDHVPVYTILNVKVAETQLKPRTVKVKPRWDNLSVINHSTGNTLLGISLHLIYQQQTMSLSCPLASLLQF